MLRKLMVLTAGVVILAAAAQAADGVRETSFSEPGGQRVLQQSIVIAAPGACAWAAFTNEAAIRASGMGMAHVDLRNGGLIEEGFTAAAQPGGPDTIRHEVIAYLPERLLVLRNRSSPPGLPHAELYRQIVQVITIDAAGEGQIRLTISHTGYGFGADYDALYGFFRGGNARYLETVKTACERKPVP